MSNKAKLLLLICLAFVIIYTKTTVAAEKTLTQESCDKTYKKIATITNKMKQSYTAKQGESYRKALTKLYQKEGQCNKKRFKKNGTTTRSDND